MQATSYRRRAARPAAQYSVRKEFLPASERNGTTVAFESIGNLEDTDGCALHAVATGNSGSGKGELRRKYIENGACAGNIEQGTGFGDDVAGNGDDAPIEDGAGAVSIRIRREQGNAGCREHAVRTEIDRGDGVCRIPKKGRRVKPSTHADSPAGRIDRAEQRDGVACDGDAGLGISADD